MYARRRRRHGPFRVPVCAAVGFALTAASAPAEVMLQWFETEWDEMYRRLPEVAEVGYDYLWVPPPTKGPTGQGTRWGNVGYNLYDRFDLGDVPQRGSLATRYGTRGSLRAMVDAAHHCDVKVIPDIVMNHNGNGPDFRDYPGMRPEDFHVQWEPNHAGTLNYKRGPRMDQWYHGEGYGGTMWQELVSLIDIRTEPDDRFTGGNNTPGWNLVAGASFLRHVGQTDLYPYYPAGYGSETAAALLNRWIAWLGNTMDFDGLRLDAGKHVPWEFFGTRGSGFLHEAQWNYNARRGYSDGNADEADDLFRNDLAERDDLLVFAEILSGQGELAYWFGGPLTSVANNTRNPMRFLDYPLKQKLYDAFSNGNLAALTAGGGGIDPQLGIMYAWGHDEAGPSKINLAYAYILTHIGFPMVYFTGNNITWADHNVRTWMRPGYDSQALGDAYGDIRNLVWIHQQFARGREHDRWNENDFFAYERYDDINSNGSPDAGEGLLLVALNDSGWDQTRYNITCSFPVGTVLHDYTGHNPADETVYSGAGGLPQVNVTVPAGGGQGWVCYAPRVADGAGAEPIRFTQGGAPAGTLAWIVPGGQHAPAKPRQLARITAATVTADVLFSPLGGTVGSVMMKWGRGDTSLVPGNYYETGNWVEKGRYTELTPRNATNWYADIDLDAAGIPEGLNVVKARVFNAGGRPWRFTTLTRTVYVDRRGPDADIAFPAEGQTVRGEAVAVIRNPDRTAYGVTVSLDGNPAAAADEIMKGEWRFTLAGLSSGNHTMTVTCTEADWGNPRTVINTSLTPRVFAVAANAQPIALTHANGAELRLPFFTTGVSAPGTPDRVSLYWDGYELPFNAGGLTHTFNGEIIRRDLNAVVTNRLWGAFCNGPHVFEAERVDGGVTSRVSRRVVFNLYGIGAIDSDGDGLPDNVEMPFIDTDGAPGPDAPWPGDSNRDFIPNYGEQWTRLNPYNHSTFYTGQWDDRGDVDGDGYSNGDEVLAGYALGNIYTYGIYDAASHPSGPPQTPSSAAWAPAFAQRGQTLTITYTPADGPLKGQSPVWIHIGHSLKTRGAWQDVGDAAMTPSGADWVYAYSVPTNATSVDFAFRSAAGDRWDNHEGRDWQAGVAASADRWFTMDGAPDSANYLVFPDATKMKLYAAVKGQNLYVATWGVPESAAGNDHFLFVTDEPGDAHEPAPGWKKSGVVFADTSRTPVLQAEGENTWEGWLNVSGAAANGPGGGVLEGEFNLVDAFGTVPAAVYIAAAAYGTADGGTLVSQGPYAWEADGNLDAHEFLRVPVASVRDDDLDGTFDMGKPRMWTVVGGSTNDVNYGLRRILLNERAHETVDLTVILQPEAGSAAVSDVELFSNLNRRDFARMEEDPSTVTPASGDTYYRAYPMPAIGGGRYALTLPVSKCGAYRVNARYRVNGGPYVYYTDHGLRRDCAVVVSPRKALDVVLYELNPLTAEATNDTFYGRSTFHDMATANADRPDAINPGHFTSLGATMIWLQPIHPIGGDGRQTDPATGLAYDPGSPYAVRNYWKVNAVLGDPSTEAQAMAEFQGFVAAMDSAGVGVMLDGTFNHSAWDCEIGEPGVTMGIASNPAALIRDVRPQWYSRRDRYGEHATHYEGGSNHDIATAPDRVDFGKWPDAADFFFGRYDALVQGPVTDTNNAATSRWYRRHLFEEDRFEGHDAYTRELWEYFAAYPLYWLEKTGHPAGTPPEQSYQGIDGLRCDFAQGLPSAFWEYVINRTRSVKWDFVFMAESLDGNREVGGSPRHGVGYRSSRHFDVLNENMVFYWRDQFFNYYDRANAAPYTYPTQQAFDKRRQAFDTSPLLLNLTSHDEIYPAHDPYRVFYAYCELAALDGVPMLFYGQEAGAQNDHTTDPWIPDDTHNFARYELNFGKSIPNFKRYNHMRNIWTHRDWTLQGLYARVNAARRASPALRSQEVYFLSRTDTSLYDPDIFAVAKVEQPGVSAATQDVVLAFVNNNYWASTNRWATFALNASHDGRNRFGIESGRAYNVVDLASAAPSTPLWGADRTGDDLIANGITVGLTAAALAGGQAQFLRLVDTAAAYPDSDGDGQRDYTDWDDDNDGLPDAWEEAHGLNPLSAADDDGAGGDPDGDGMTNEEELVAGTDPRDPDDALAIRRVAVTADQVRVEWPARAGRSYQVEHAATVTTSPVPWQALGPFRTAVTDPDAATDVAPAGEKPAYYRVKVRR